MYVQKINPLKKKQKGGGTRKTCLPAAKIASMSKKERSRLVSAKQKSGKTPTFLLCISKVIFHLCFKKILQLNIDLKVQAISNPFFANLFISFLV